MCDSVNVEVNNDSASQNDVASKKAVRFGDVKLYQSKRCIGMDIIPSNGHGWPVGLSNEVLEFDAAKYSIDDHVVLQQVRVR